MDGGGEGTPTPDGVVPPLVALIGVRSRVKELTGRLQSCLDNLQVYAAEDGLTSLPDMCLTKGSMAAGTSPLMPVPMRDLHDLHAHGGAALPLPMQPLHAPAPALGTAVASSAQSVRGSSSSSGGSQLSEFDPAVLTAGSPAPASVDSSAVHTSVGTVAAGASLGGSSAAAGGSGDGGTAGDTDFEGTALPRGWRISSGGGSSRWVRGSSRSCWVLGGSSC